MRSAAAAAADPSMSATQMFAPAVAKRAAIAVPIPVAAPVTTANCPVRSNILNSLRSRGGLRSRFHHFFELTARQHRLRNIISPFALLPIEPNTHYSHRRCEVVTGFGPVVPKDGPDSNRWNSFLRLEFDVEFSGHNRFDRFVERRSIIVEDGFQEHAVIQCSEPPEARLAKTFTCLGVIVLTEHRIFQQCHVKQAS